MAPARILVLDPLTLIGKEFFGCHERLETFVTDIEYRHAAEDEEHQIAEVGTGPALVAPLEASENLEGFDVIVVASDRKTPRHKHLLEFLDSHPEAALLDAGRLDFLNPYTTPSLGKVNTSSRQLRVGHPALAATSAVIEVLEPLGRLGGSVAAVDPVSVGGQEAIERLAEQARLRVQGAPVEKRIAGHVLAFNVVAVESDDLQEEATQLLPDTPLTVTRSLAGFFHGHLAHLSLTYATPVDPDAVRQALSLADEIEEGQLPLALDKVPDNDSVLLTPPIFSPDKRHLALTAMADGLRVGGALTAVDILETLV
jgi:hypothetical protein